MFTLPRIHESARLVYFSNAGLSDVRPAVPGVQQCLVWLARM